MKSIDDAPRGAVVTVIGPPESGKSELLWRLYTSQSPRVLTIEVVPETERRLAHLRAEKPRRAYGYDRTLAELRECAELASGRWHIVTTLDRDEIAELFAVLCPIEDNGPRVSFAKAVGGLTVACNELSYMAPNKLTEDSAVHRAYVMYRHHWLSIHGAVQHAPNCLPAARLSADRVIFLRTTDDLSLEAIARASSREIARLVEELPQYHSITFIKSRGRAYVADERYRVTAELDHRGRSLSSGADSLTPALSAGATPSAGNDVSQRRAGQRLARG